MGRPAKDALFIGWLLDLEHFLKFECEYKPPRDLVKIEFLIY